MQYLRDSKTLLDDSMKIIERALASENLPSIERNILLDKLAKAYELLLFSVEKQAEPTHQAHSQHTVKANAETTTQSIKRDQPLSTPSHNVEPVAPAGSYSKKPPEQIQKFREKAPSTNESKSIEVEPTPGAASTDRPATLADKFQDKQKSLNETIANQARRSDMGTKLQNKPITDLAKAIGINDKFLFTNELFDGDSALYAETVNRLNEMDDLNEAIIYLQDNFSWSATSEAASKFIDLLRRKFAL